MNQLLLDRVEKRMADHKLLVKVTFLAWFLGILKLNNASIISSGPEALNRNNELKELWRIIYSDR